jgi:hypothetical protein
VTRLSALVIQLYLLFDVLVFLTSLFSLPRVPPVISQSSFDAVYVQGGLVLYAFKTAYDTSVMKARIEARMAEGYIFSLNAFVSSSALC